MARHQRNGATLEYRFRFGPMTPKWLDCGSSGLAGLLGRNACRARLIRRTFHPANGA